MQEKFAWQTQIRRAWQVKRAAGIETIVPFLTKIRFAPGLEILSVGLEQDKIRAVRAT